MCCAARWWTRGSYTVHVAQHTVVGTTLHKHAVPDNQRIQPSAFDSPPWWFLRMAAALVAACAAEGITVPQWRLGSKPLSVVQHEVLLECQRFTGRPPKAGLQQQAGHSTPAGKKYARGSSGQRNATTPPIPANGRHTSRLPWLQLFAVTVFAYVCALGPYVCRTLLTT